MTSVVYLIGSPDHGHVKIGIAKDVERRLATLQTGNHHTLQVLATMPGGLRLERLLHSYFADRHTRGEWYEFPARDAVAHVRILLEAVAKVVAAHQTSTHSGLSTQQGLALSQLVMASSQERLTMHGFIQLLTSTTLNIRTES
jgi:Meiotically Up-regulated Gene 113 (MUG113) protein